MHIQKAIRMKAWIVFLVFGLYFGSFRNAKAQTVVTGELTGTVTDPTGAVVAAPTTGLPFPNTTPALFANQGETMAQTLARISCTKGSTLPCSSSSAS